MILIPGALSGRLFFRNRWWGHQAQLVWCSSSLLSNRGPRKVQRPHRESQQLRRRRSLLRRRVHRLRSYYSNNLWKYVVNQVRLIVIIKIMLAYESWGADRRSPWPSYRRPWRHLPRSHDNQGGHTFCSGSPELATSSSFHTMTHLWRSSICEPHLFKDKAASRGRGSLVASERIKIKVRIYQQKVW